MGPLVVAFIIFLGIILLISYVWGRSDRTGREDKRGKSEGEGGKGEGEGGNGEKKPIAFPPVETNVDTPNDSNHSFKDLVAFEVIDKEARKRLYEDTRIKFPEKEGEEIWQIIYEQLERQWR